MGSEFTFYDFVDDEGHNVIRQWMDGIPKGAKAKFNNWLSHLEATPPGKWKRPLVDTLDGPCADLFEVRVSLSRHQYRILGSHSQDRRPTLLHCFIKPDNRVEERECVEALRRKELVETDPKKHKVEHDYG